MIWPNRHQQMTREHAQRSLEPQIKSRRVIGSTGTSVRQFCFLDITSLLFAPVLATRIVKVE